MKIIFLDVDGVLNGYGYGTKLAWDFARFTKSDKVKDFIRKLFDPCGVHKSKVKRLSKIIKATGAKVVMSSARRFSFWKKPYQDMSTDLKRLVDLFIEYDIDVIDITPRLCSNRDQEILNWLAINEENIDKFIILDDENTILKLFKNDRRFIQTSKVNKGEMITGHYKECTGLKNRHVKEAIKILNEE